METGNQRSRFYSSYVSSHAGQASEVAERMYFDRDIRPHLPVARDAAIIDVGCGQGHVVRNLLRLGYDQARGIDISPEQVELAHQSGLTQVALGDYRTGLGRVDVVIATDFLEHFSKDEVVRALDTIHQSLKPGGKLVMRVPNSVSPFSGNFQHGDFTHETAFTPRSLAQLAKIAGFNSCECFPCKPVGQGLGYGSRRFIWALASAGMKLVLAAEVGPRRGHIVTQNVVAVMSKG